MGRVAPQKASTGLEVRQLEQNFTGTARVVPGLLDIAGAVGRKVPVRLPPP